jgi:ABC-2 type transport system permease protein
VTALVGRSLGRIAAPFAGVLLILTGFQIALIAVAATFSESGNFERLSQLVPSVLQASLAPALISFDRMTTLGYFDALIVMMLVQWAIYVATEPAGDVEDGIVDLVLARPVPRHLLVTRTFIVMVATTTLLALAMLLGTVSGLALLAPANSSWPNGSTLLLMASHLTMVAWCFGAAGLAASAWTRRRTAAIAIVAIASVAAYLIDFLGLWWSPMETLARLTPFFYFHGGPLLAGTDNPLRNLSVLAGITAAFTICAYVRFQRRDL